MRTLIPKTQVMNIHIIGSGGKKKKSSLIGCMQMSSYWGSGTAVGKKKIATREGGGGRGVTSISTRGKTGKEYVFQGWAGEARIVKMSKS